MSDCSLEFDSIAWKDFVRSAAGILDDYQRNKKFPLEAAWARVEEKGAGIDSEIVDFLMNSLSEMGADREGFAELVELLKREPSLAEFHEYMHTEATSPIWQISTRLYSWLANVLRVKRQKP